MARKLSAQQIEDGTASYSAEELTDTASGLIEGIRRAAIAETRKDFAEALASLAKGSARQLTACMEGDKREVTDDLRAGLALAAELLADENFEA